MASPLQIKAVSVLALICLLQCSVYGQLQANNLVILGNVGIGKTVTISVPNTDRSVAIRVRYDGTSSSMINVTFPVDTFRSFYGPMCKSSPEIEAWYATEGSLNDKPVGAINYMTEPKDFQNIPSVYQCQNNPLDPDPPSLDCVRLHATSGLSERCVRTQSFRLNDAECQSRCVTLVWFNEYDSITFNTRNMSDLRYCDAAVSCLPATQRPPSIISSTTTSSTTTTPPPSTTTGSLVTSITSSTTTSSPFASSTTTTNDNDNENNTTDVGIIPDDDNDPVDNTVVIIGVIVAVVVIVIIVVIAVVWWRRRQKQGNKKPENHNVNSPMPFGVKGAASSADPSSNVNSRPSENADMAPGDRSPSTPASAYSQLQIRDPNTNEHTYAALKTDPYYNSINGTTINGTNVHNSSIPKHRAAYYNALDSTTNNPSTSSKTPNVSPNGVPVYTFIPSSTSDGSYAYPDETTTSAANPSRSTRRNPYITPIDVVYSEADIANSTATGTSGVSAGNNSTQRNSYISIIGEPGTEVVYSEADVRNSTVTGNRFGVSARNPNNQRNSYISLIGEPGTEAVYSEADVANSTRTGNRSGVSAGNNSTQRNSYISLIGERGTEGVYSDADVAYSTVRGDYANRNATAADRVTGRKVKAPYSNLSKSVV